VALVSRNDKIIGLFGKRDLSKRRYSAKETYNFVDPTDRSDPMPKYKMSMYTCIYTPMHKTYVCTYIHILARTLRYSLYSYALIFSLRIRFDIQYSIIPYT